MFALVDCNNFYASCERLFRPDLHYKPIVVLSNNDGCIIARSNEAKALGIAMGEPYFKAKAICQQNHVAVFSSNYAFYGDMSRRVMHTILEQWPEAEMYSIDEAFLNLQSMDEAQRTVFCQKLQAKILKYTGIPTSIGIGHTKTQAKLANYIAKKQLCIPVFNLAIAPHWLDKISVGEVWGVGRRLAVKLMAMNILTAGDLARADKAWLRKQFSVVLQRTAYELQGLACLALESQVPKQSIIASRSFGVTQTQLFSLEEAVSAHVARAWRKLRQQHSLVTDLSVFTYLNRSHGGSKHYSNRSSLHLAVPLDDLSQLTQLAKKCLRQIYKANVGYKKVGISFDAVVPKHVTQQHLFDTIDEDELNKNEQVMHVIERINRRFGRSTVTLAAEGIAKSWTMKSHLRSPGYTTRWQDLPIVRVRHAKFKKAIP